VLFIKALALELMYVGEYIDDFLDKFVTPLSILVRKGRGIKAIFGVLNRVIILYDNCRLPSARSACRLQAPRVSGEKPQTIAVK
jgi:hypothetical protein